MRRMAQVAIALLTLAGAPVGNACTLGSDVSAGSPQPGRNAHQADAYGLEDASWTTFYTSGTIRSGVYRVDNPDEENGYIEVTCSCGTDHGGNRCAPRTTSTTRRETATEPKKANMNAGKGGRGRYRNTCRTAYTVEAAKARQGAGGAVAGGPLRPARGGNRRARNAGKCSDFRTLPAPGRTRSSYPFQRVRRTLPKSRPATP